MESMLSEQEYNAVIEAIDLAYEILCYVENPDVQIKEARALLSKAWDLVERSKKG